MKDIPVFTAANGIATLVLKEIPHCGRAYVLIRAVWTDAAALLEECRGFCRACGAEEIYASWDTEELPAAPAYDLLEMTCRKADLPQPTAPVQLVELCPENGPQYLEIYNRCFHNLPGAATYGNQDLQRLYGEELAYLAVVDNQFAGVAEISKDTLEGIGVLPEHRGLGYNLALAVLDRIPSVNLHLKVANTNERALALYTRLGFRVQAVVRRWYLL